MLSLGYNIYLIRVQAYALSAFIISVAGALYALNHSSSAWKRSTGAPRVSR